ncbi:hypothetical protein [Tsukamurella sp. 1534]|uniref:AMIN-like domain-containing (lipo)protein n=1 Tax=Tsukamurella sp. 1534 TaxID=1151061 RepID=UPI0002DBADAA|nr:hypothetical protein [Tsukamurella sp. 1534]
MLSDLRTGARDGSDRLVLEFTGQAPPYTVTRKSGPIDDCASGNRVAGEGQYLVIRAEPVGIFDHDGRSPYTGPRTVPGPGGAITRAAVSCAFEGQLQVAVRLAGDGLGYKDFTLSGPGRIVLDVQQ